MIKILHIETSTKVCSVGVSIDGRMTGLREENNQSYSHSSVLTHFIEQALEQSGLQIKDLSAVAVSMGPGSYTGLRIGVSAAKGICYALEIPLIAVDTLQALAHNASRLLQDDSDQNQLLQHPHIFCPMIDARRMEVYYNLFDHQLNPLGTTAARIIQSDTFNNPAVDKTLIIIGDGALKCKGVIQRAHTVFMPHILPSVQGMVDIAHQKYQHKSFEDVAYFEPFYLKDFVAGPSKVKGLFR